MPNEVSAPPWCSILRWRFRGPSGFSPGSVRFVRAEASMVGCKLSEDAVYCCTAARRSLTRKATAPHGSVTSALTYSAQRSAQTMVLAVILPGFHEGILKTIFVDTWVSLSLFGQPAGGFKLTLIDLVIVGVLAFAVTAITEWLTGGRLATCSPAWW